MRGLQGLTRRTAGGLALAVLAAWAVPAGSPVHAESVYGDGLFQLGDGDPPPGTSGMADIEQDELQPGPDWAGLFDAEGAPVDADGNGVADYLELYSGLWAVFADDDVSLGSGFEGSAINDEGQVFNSVVDADHDLGNAYVYVTTSQAGNLVLYAAAERLGGGDSSLEFEFNQGRFVLGRGGYGEGRPWEVVGERQPGDLLLALTFAGGGLGSVEARVWGGEAWYPMTSAFGEGCDGGELLCAVCNATEIDGGPWVNHDPDEDPETIGTGRFVELGVNAGALLGAQPDFATVRIRTPQDTAFGYFTEGN